MGQGVVRELQKNLQGKCKWNWPRNKVIIA